MQRTFPRQEKPYLDSDRIATPHPNSLRSAYWNSIVKVVQESEQITKQTLCPQTSNYGENVRKPRAVSEHQPYLGNIPGSVLMCRTLHESKLGFICGIRTVKIQWKFDCGRGLES